MNTIGRIGAPKLQNTKNINKLISSYLAIDTKTALDDRMVTYMTRSFVLATFPHKNNHETVFRRKNGDYFLTLKATPSFGLPYGSLPRLLLAWITKEAINNKSPEISLGKTYKDFLHALGLSKSGGRRGDATRLKEQFLRLFTTSISYTYVNKQKGICKSENFTLSKSFEFWWNPKTEHAITRKSKIILSTDFFNELVNESVPLDFRMLKALSKSPLQMDIYSWLTHRFSYLKKPSSIAWTLLKEQFGADYAENAQGLRDFKKHFIKSLHVVKMMYADANIEIEKTGVLLKPSKTHVPTKKAA